MIKILYSIVLIVALMLVNTHLGFTQTPDSYFHNSANVYIHGDSKKAKAILNDGLRVFPNDEKLQSLKKKMKEEEEQKQKEQQQQQQKQDQQKKDQQKQEQQKQDQQKQDQQKQQAQQQQGAQKKQQISKADAERILEALKNDEKKVQKKLQKKAPARVQVEKDW